MAARKTFPPLRPADERFDEQTVRDTSGCLLWTGTVQNKGYGVFYEGRRRQVLAHRWALARKLGRPIGPGMECLHSCDTPPCVDPMHLSEGSHGRNMAECSQRGRSARPSKLIDACKFGHEFSPENTLWKTRVFKGGGKEYEVRICRECKRRQCGEYRARRKIREDS